ncbi:hypothetical protein [Portibacter lacus]|uniref:Uncharacterized protein n=1 Tax=Portibacter lacus TaxID=1099794 RepID=A0AA37SRY3_9BACT|nr:hypothetical protein [Portibacter lacus]GLR16985.1 hypothetical protein GCM10007940_16000 [Portibacter lacus]
MNRNKPSFSQFLDFFPPVELPVNLTDDSLIIFSKENKALPVVLLQEFILEHDQSETDEFTEYVPCFQIPNTENFYAVVYWKAQLLTYEYRLITFDLQGNFITGKVIGGTLTNGNTVIKTVANIDEDWIIHIASGEDDVRNPNYNAENTKAYTMELLSTGDIIFSLSDDDLPL